MLLLLPMVTFVVGRAPGVMIANVLQFRRTNLRFFPRPRGVAQAVFYDVVNSVGFDNHTDHDKCSVLCCTCDQATK